MRYMLKKLAVATVVSLAAVGSAHAIVVVGEYDPTYGAPYNDLGWRGTVTVFVPDTCVPTGSGVVSNATACGGAAHVLAAQVNLYHVSDPGQPTLATLNFDPATISLIDLRFSSGQLDGLQTTISAPVLDTSPVYAWFSLQFTFVNTAGIAIPDGVDYDGPKLYWQNPIMKSDRGLNDPAIPPVTVFTPVPEPATLALWLGGLGLLAGASSRAQRLR